MLSFIAALACLEVGSGVVVSEVWRRRQIGQLGIDLLQLDDMLARLRVIETVVVGGAAVMTVLWAVAASYNAGIAARNGRLAPASAAAWLVVPMIVVGIDQIDRSAMPVTFTIIIVMLQVAILFVPFAVLGNACEQVGGLHGPFVRWYAAVVVAFAVERLLVGSDGLVSMRASDDLGRAASMSLVNGVVVGVVVVMAMEASSAMETSIRHFMRDRDRIRRDAFDRFGTKQDHGAVPVIPGS